MNLKRGDGDPVVLPDAVHFPMKCADGRTVFCRVTHNALAMKAKSQTWLSEEEARTIFVRHRDEIEEAARTQYGRGIHFVTIGASELTP